MISYITTLPASQKLLILTEIQKHIIPESPPPDCGTSAVSVRFNTSTLLCSPLLNSALSETLRLQFNGLSVRGVSQPTYIPVATFSSSTTRAPVNNAQFKDRGYFVDKGDTVFLVMPCVHKNPEIYTSPNEYQLDRFEKMWSDKFNGNVDAESKGWFFKQGKAVKYPLMPWGGGHFMVLSESLVPLFIFYPCLCSCVRRELRRSRFVGESNGFVVLGAKICNW